MVEEPEPTNPTFYDKLKRRNERQEETLKRYCDGDFDKLGDYEPMTHCHMAVKGGLVWLTFWAIDPVTKVMHGQRVTLPYEHWLLMARGTVGAHDEEEALELHAAQGSD